MEHENKGFNILYGKNDPRTIDYHYNKIKNIPKYPVCIKYKRSQKLIKYSEKIDVEDKFKLIDQAI